MKSFIASVLLLLLLSASVNGEEVTTNIALGKPATATGSVVDSAFGIDGDLNTYVPAVVSTYTVNLQGIYQVREIRLTPRSDDTSKFAFIRISLFSGAELIHTMSTGAHRSSHFVFKYCKEGDSFDEAPVVDKVVLEPGTHSTDKLEFAEVELWGVIRCYDVNCDVCTTSRSCRRCATGFVQYNGQCVVTCPIGSRDEDGVCVACPVDWCATCSDANTCTSCVSPRSLQPTSVQSCVVGCPSGYHDVNGVCIDVDECAAAGACDALTMCQNTPVGSYTCTPCPTGYTGTGKTGCVACGENCDLCDTPSYCVACSSSFFQHNGQCVATCPAGFREWRGTCVDEDECASAGACDALTTCSNTVGSYSCSQCPDGYTGNGKTGCADIDECASGTSTCQGNAICNNNAGSYTCSCPSGYELDVAATACNDIDECARGAGTCQGNAICNNNAGSYTCTCPSGYELNVAGTACNDIDECARGTSTCQGNAICSNNVGSHSCSCPSGYELNIAGTACNDINECARGTSTCQGNAICNNNIGSHSCSCPSGYELNAAGTACNDIDECARGTSTCQGNAVCNNNIGSHSCSCPLGYELNTAATACNDVDECARGTSTCQGNAICNNNVGSYTCSCPSGYELNTARTTCIDIDECARGTSTCQGNAICNNNVGSHSCSCPSGYELNAAGTVCNDIDECQLGTHTCNTNKANCENTPGGYRCACKGAFMFGDGDTCSYCGNNDTCLAHGVCNQHLTQRCTNCQDGASGPLCQCSIGSCYCNTTTNNFGFWTSTLGCLTASSPGVCKAKLWDGTVLTCNAPLPNHVIMLHST